MYYMQKKVTEMWKSLKTISFAALPVSHVFWLSVYKSILCGGVYIFLQYGQVYRMLVCLSLFSAKFTSVAVLCKPE